MNDIDPVFHGPVRPDNNVIVGFLHQIAPEIIRFERKKLESKMLNQCILFMCCVNHQEDWFGLLGFNASATARVISRW